MKNIPDTVYIQIDDDSKDEEDFRNLDTTYCEDRIYENDIEYIRKGELEGVVELLYNLIDQQFRGWAEDENGQYRTQYNVEAQVIDYLSKKDLIEIVEGEWPKTKFIIFKFKER